MVKKRLIWFNLLLMFCVMAGAQELKVKSFETTTDVIAKTQPRYDKNDVACAIVRVSVANAKEFVFEGNLIGDVIYSPGEAKVYMPAHSRYLTIKSDKFGALKYQFPERLKKEMTYKLELKVVIPESKKTRTLVMPLVGLGKVTSFGMMLGIVKKWGGYVKVKSNFSNQSTSLACNSQGIIEGSSTQAWLTGKSASSRFALTGGVLYRVALPFYLYAGGGFGSKKLAWEMPNDTWAEVSDASYNGLEAELGGIYRIKNFAMSAGIQTNQFKYWEATVGVAFMF